MTKLLQSIEGLQIMNTDHLYVTDYSQVMMKADVQGESKKAESMLVWAHECFKKNVIIEWSLWILYRKLIITLFSRIMLIFLSWEC